MILRLSSRTSRRGFAPFAWALALGFTACSATEIASPPSDGSERSGAGAAAARAPTTAAAPTSARDGEGVRKAAEPGEAPGEDPGSLPLDGDRVEHLPEEVPSARSERVDRARMPKREAEAGRAAGIGSLGVRGSGAGGGGYGHGSGSAAGRSVGLLRVVRGVSGGVSGSAFGSASGALSDVVAEGDFAPQAPPMERLRAGATDDNADFAAYRTFLGKWSERASIPRGYRTLDVEGRSFVRVVDTAGKPVSGVEVQATDGMHTWRGTTYGDGVAPLYIGRAQGPVTVRLASEAQVAEQPIPGPLLEKNETQTLTLDSEVAEVAKVPLDVTFLIDTTSSMDDEIARIKATLLRMTKRIQNLGRPVDLRYAAVLYRDHGDDYVTREIAFTRDLRAFDRTLSEIEASGGGDTPEALNEGLAAAVNLHGWRTGAAKVVFLIADAPPHPESPGSTPYRHTVEIARERGIRVHAVAASGLDAFGSLVFRQIAQYTRGKFIFIEYGGDLAGSAAAHGISGQVQSNNLDEILYREVEREVLGFRKAPVSMLGAR